MFVQNFQFGSNK